MKNYYLIALGIIVILVAQLVFHENDNGLWVPRIILTIVGVAIAGMAWDTKRNKRE